MDLVAAMKFEADSGSILTATTRLSGMEKATGAAEKATDKLNGTSKSVTTATAHLAATLEKMVAVHDATAGAAKRAGVSQEEFARRTSAFEAKTRALADAMNQRQLAETNAAAASANSFRLTAGAALGLFGIYGSGQVVQMALVEGTRLLIHALGEEERARQRAAEATQSHNDAMGRGLSVLRDINADTAAGIKPTDDLATATFRLADARRQSAVAALQESRAKTAAQIEEVQRSQKLGTVWERLAAAGSGDAGGMPSGYAGQGSIQVGVKADGSPLMRTVQAAEALKELNRQQVENLRLQMAITMAVEKEKPAREGATGGARAHAAAVRENTDAEREAQKALERQMQQAADFLDRFQPSQIKAWNEMQEGLAAVRAEVEAGRRSWIEYEWALQNVEWSRLTPFRAKELPKDLELQTPGGRQTAANDNFDAEVAYLQRAFSDVSGSAYGLAYDLKRNDVGGVLLDLVNAIMATQRSLATFGGALGKIGAAAGLASIAGTAIGGTAGSAIVSGASGALAGAAIAGSKLGTMIMPGLGTVAGAVIGGLIGGIGSLLGSSSAKKKARQEEEERRRQAELQRQQEILNTQRQQEIDLLYAQGDAVGAIAKSRQFEYERLEALQAGLGDAQRAIDDLNDAAAKAAETLRERTELERQFSDLFETDAQRLASATKTVNDTFAGLNLTVPKTASEFQDLVLGLGATDASAGSAYEQLLKVAPAFKTVADAAEAAAQKMLEDARAYQADIFNQAQENARIRQEAIDKARADLQAAYQRERSEIEQTIAALQAAADWYAAYKQSLAFDPTAVAAGAMTDAARAAFLKVANDPKSSTGQFQTAADRLLSAAQESSTSRLAYAREVAEVKRGADAQRNVALDPKDVATRQLDALNNSVIPYLGAINDNTMTTAQALTAYLAALAGGPNGTKTNPVTGAPDLKNIGGVTSVDFTDGRSQADQLADWFKAYAAANPTADVGKWVDLNTGQPYARDANGQPVGGQTYAWNDPARADAEQANGYQSWDAAYMMGIPGYASGGMHRGGLRIVGEHGPELEATGPSRIFTAEQTRWMLAGSGDPALEAIQAQTERMVGLLVEIRDNTAYAAEAIRYIADFGVFAHGEQPGLPVSTKEAA